MKNNGEDILEYLTLAKGEYRTDVVSSDKYRDKFPANPAGDSLYLNLIMNVNGARFKKSWSGEAWPVLATVVELPPVKRHRYGNSIALGFWIGHKPDFDVYLREMLLELNENWAKTGFYIK